MILQSCTTPSKWSFRNKLQWKWTPNVKLFYAATVFQNVSCKMSASSFQPQYVTRSPPSRLELIPLKPALSCFLVSRPGGVPSWLLIVFHTDSSPAESMDNLEITLRVQCHPLKRKTKSISNQRLGSAIAAWLHWKGKLVSWYFYLIILKHFLHDWLFARESTGHQWIPFTKGQ